MAQAKSKGLEVQLAEARQRQAEAATAQVQAQAAVAQAGAEARERSAHQELAAATGALSDYQDTVSKSSDVNILSLLLGPLDPPRLALSVACFTISEYFQEPCRHLCRLGPQWHNKSTYLWA